MRKHTPTTVVETTLSHKLALRLRMRHLLILQAIQEHRSLTQVAHHMATSQPAVTQLLADMEALFGGPLFERSPRGMLPTELGTLVLARAEAMLANLGHWAQDIEALNQGRAAHLHVGVIPFLPGRLLATAINHTRPYGRRITVTLQEDSSDHLLERLRSHELDCVIGRASAVLDMTELQHDVLYQQEPRLIAHKRLAERLADKPLRWHALAELDWILGARQTPMREQITDFFMRAGVTPPAPIVESLSAKVIGELVAANERAVSIVPADVAEELVRIAGVAIMRHRFGWTLPPVSLFQRISGAQYEEQKQFAAALKLAARDIALSTQ